VKLARRTTVTPRPTITQVEMVDVLNRAMATSYSVPATGRDAAFLIDGMIAEERKFKRSRRRVGR
jgi:hypothetical protein